MQNERTRVLARARADHQRESAALAGHAMIAGLAILSLAIAVVGMITQLV